MNLRMGVKLQVCFERVVQGVSGTVHEPKIQRITVHG